MKHTAMQLLGDGAGTVVLEVCTQVLVVSGLVPAAKTLGQSHMVVAQRQSLGTALLMEVTQVVSFSLNDFSAINFQFFS